MVQCLIPSAVTSLGPPAKLARASDRAVFPPGSARIGRTRRALLGASFLRVYAELNGGPVNLSKGKCLHEDPLEECMRLGVICEVLHRQSPSQLLEFRNGKMGPQSLSPLREQDGDRSQGREDAVALPELRRGPTEITKDLPAHQRGAVAEGQRERS